jgi:hypothetical protein
VKRRAGHAKGGPSSPRSAGRRAGRRRLAGGSCPTSRALRGPGPGPRPAARPVRGAARFCRRSQRKVPSSCPSRCSCCASSTTRPRPRAGSRRQPPMPGADTPPPVPDVPLEWGDGLGPRGEPAAAQPECSRSADRMVSHPAGRDGRVIPSQVPAHDGARRIDRRAPSAWEERSGLMNQAARSARSVAGAGRAFSPAGTSARGRGCGARAERIMASDAHTSSSLTYRRVRIARRRAVIAHPGRRRRGRRVAVIAITSFVLRGSLDVWFCLRDGPPAWGSDLPLPLESS